MTLNKISHISAYIMRGAMDRGARLWCKMSWEGREFKAGLHHPMTVETLSVNQAVNGYLFRFREGKGNKRSGIGSAFHQLCPRYSKTLTPTTLTAIRLWETFTLLTDILKRMNIINVFLHVFTIRNMCKHPVCYKMDGRMTCNFMSFSTVFQSYQDNRRVIMKGCVQWNPST